jgi:hypothetical protein
MTHIAPGKPWKNGKNESSTGSFEENFLNAAWFASIANPSSSKSNTGGTLMRYALAAA